jgi:hypothetical protein
MELLIVIAPLLIVFVVGYIIISIQDWITDARFYRQRHLRELKLAMMQLKHPEFFSRTHDVSADEIRKALAIYETSGVTTTLSTGEVETLGPGKVYVFGGPKVGTVTSTVGYEQLEEMGATLNEAERLIKEAHDRAVD